jgi:trehalose 6-phosphate synthase
MSPHLDLLLANRAYADHNEPPPGPQGPITGGSGGLLAAVRPVIEPWNGTRGTTWIGAGTGTYDRQYVDQHGVELIETPRGPLRHQRLFFDAETWRRHYADTANATLWPMLHLAIQPLWERTDYFPRPQPPQLDEWSGYVAVNGTIAHAAMAAPNRDICWVHDYQLALVPNMLRERRYPGRIGFFLHTPFPDIDLVEQSGPPQVMDVFTGMVEGLLGADLVGFQTEDDAERFRAAAERTTCAARSGASLKLAGRMAEVGAYPVGIDIEATEDAARAGAFPERLREAAASSLPLIVGLERADYTKGIPERLRAVAEAWRRGARFHYAGFSSPTREEVEAYQRLGREVAAATGEAEAAAREAGCQFTQSTVTLPWDEVVGLMRDADVVFTSSLSDGMNLVPLQAAIAQADTPAGERGVVVAGIGAGVANAYADCIGEGLETVDALDHEAMVQALVDASAGRYAPVSDMFIERVRERDARHWARRFLEDLGATE